MATAAIVPPAPSAGGMENAAGGTTGDVTEALPPPAEQVTEDLLDTLLGSPR